MLSEVPEGWRTVRLSDVAAINADTLGQRTSPDFAFGYIDISQIDQPGVCLGWTPTTFATAPSRARRVVRENDIIVSTVRPYLRAFAMVPSSDGSLIASTGFAVVRAHEEVDQDFLFRHIMAADFIDHLKPRMTGSNYPAVSAGDVADYEFSCPPLDEQRRIADVLRSASVACEAAQRVVEKYGVVIQSEIDSVVSDLIADPSIPLVCLGDVAMVKGGKRLPKGSEYSDSPTGSRYVRVTDWKDYAIDPAHVRWISSEAASAIRRYTISSADLFISIAGSIGLVASVPPELDGAHLTENAAKIVLRAGVEVDRDYLLLVMMSRSLTEQMRQQKGVGGGVPKLALFRIEALKVPLPSLDHQREIAALYRSLRAARSNANQASRSAARLCEKLANDLLSGRVRVPA